MSLWRGWQWYQVAGRYYHFPSSDTYMMDVHRRRWKNISNQLHLVWVWPGLVAYRQESPLQDLTCLWTSSSPTLWAALDTAPDRNRGFRKTVVISEAAVRDLWKWCRFLQLPSLHPESPGWADSLLPSLPKPSAPAELWPHILCSVVFSTPCSDTQVDEHPGTWHITLLWLRGEATVFQSTSIKSFTFD